MMSSITFKAVSLLFYPGHISQYKTTNRM